jgi:hypothetical protein
MPTSIELATVIQGTCNPVLTFDVYVNGEFQETVTLTPDDDINITID